MKEVLNHYDHDAIAYNLLNNLNISTHSVHFALKNLGAISFE
jgi:predicted ATP-dependent endonuclease of OLD family